MAEGGCSCSRCFRRTNSNDDNDGWSNVAEVSDNEIGVMDERRTRRRKTQTSELHETQAKLDEEDTQCTRSSALASFTKRLSRRLSFSRSRGNSVESTETSPRSDARRRRRNDLQKRKSWSGFRTQSKAEDTDEGEFSISSNSMEARRTSWYDRFRGVFDLRPNDGKQARNNRTAGEAPRLPQRDPFTHPLTEETFHLLRKEPQFADLSQEYKMEYFLVPDMLAVTKCPWYWGKINRYQAETVLEGLPDGTFLLRDSAQYHYLFSVSFRRYSRTYHARIEQWRHQYGFDKPGDQSFYTRCVCDLMKHYSRPEQCMYYEPLLLKPLARKTVLSLQELCRGVICDRVGFQGVLELPLPKQQKAFLREFHYKVPIRRKMEDKGTQTQLVRSRKFGMPWS